MVLRSKVTVFRLLFTGVVLFSLILWINLSSDGDNFRSVRPAQRSLHVEESPITLKIIRVGMDSENLKEANKEGAAAAEKRSKAEAAQKCIIPKLEKDRPDIAKFFKKAEPFDCTKKNGHDWLVLDDDGKIQATDYLKRKFNTELLECTWQFFYRVSDVKLRWSDAEPFKLGEKVTKGDFFKATCLMLSGEKWEGLFMTVVASSKRLAELKAVKRAENWSGLNVYILGFDSMSQMEYRRNLPKTVDYLENQLKSNIFNGFNIVGDGTPQAYIPFLTGQTEVELPLTRKRYANARFVDQVYPFAWRNFSDAGYATLYGEDSHVIGTFTYRLKGFLKQPTDHFTPTFFQELESKCGGSCQCIGGTYQHVNWFRYAESFWREYADVPRFLLLHHSSLSHDSINAVQLADADMVAHLKRMNDKGAFKNTMVIVMADHGRRFSQLRDTHQGQMEERLPFFSIYIPPEWADHQSAATTYSTALKNLRENAANRLVTHFDVHATLMDVLRWPAEEEFDQPQKPNRSLSLFRPISLDRTCSEAGIEPHWCTCLTWQSAMAEGQQLATSQMLTRAVVQVINEQTEPERASCAKLALKTLVSAKRFVPNEDLLKYNGAEDKDGFVPKLKGQVTANFFIYQLVFETMPGGAKYEATVNYDLLEPEGSVTVDLKSISHINAYGDQPHCIIDRNYFLAAYCVCYDKI